MFWYSFFIIFLPLIGAFLLLFVKPNSKRLFTNFIANTSIGISMIFSIILFIKFLFNPDISNSFELYTWIHSDKFVFSLGILVDSLSVFMAFVVTSVSFLVHVYSVGYMDKDEGYNRFFIYTNFFTF